MAAQQRRRVRLRYRSNVREVTEHLFDPYAVVYHAGRWYAAGHCHLRRRRRVFRLDRIENGTPSAGGETFTRPSDFDGLDFVLRSLAAVQAGVTVARRSSLAMAPAAKLARAQGPVRPLETGATGAG
jgi:predicted DNA-binding transcriptional regulator YafY